MREVVEESKKTIESKRKDIMGLEPYKVSFPWIFFYYFLCFQIKHKFSNRKIVIGIIPF